MNMSMSERVIVVVPKGASRVLKVVESWEDYDAWLEQSDWRENQIKHYDCRANTYK